VPWNMLILNVCNSYSDLHSHTANAIPHLVPNPVLRSPHKLDFVPDADLRHRISLYFAQLFNVQANVNLRKLPNTMTCWGKVRITNGGDKIHASCAMSAAQAHVCQDSYFVRVSN
jgi:hypothetical protein